MSIIVHEGIGFQKAKKRFTIFFSRSGRWAYFYLTEESHLWPKGPAIGAAHMATQKYFCNIRFESGVWIRECNYDNGTI